MRGESMRSVLRVTKALADGQRLRILAMLKTGELCVCQIIEVLGLAPSTVSKHLSILDNSGLVVSRKEGRWMHYRLPSGASEKTIGPVAAWVAGRLKDDETIRQDAEAVRRVVANERRQLCRMQRERLQGRARR